MPALRRRSIAGGIDVAVGATRHDTRVDIGARHPHRYDIGKGRYVMRTHAPRLAPLRDDELDADQAGILGPLRASGRDYNIFRTFARHPTAMRAFLGWGGHILSPGNTLPPRLREIAILRTGYLCRAGYEWARHVPIARREGLSDTDIAALKRDPADGPWSPGERALLAAVDELIDDRMIGDDRWAELASHFEERQMLDLIFTVGQYVMVSMFLNSAGVQLDDDVVLDPDLALLA
jgi:alkylhydroperoxidase family enzyme